MTNFRLNVLAYSVMLGLTAGVAYAAQPTNNQQPTTNNQQPTTNNQQPTTNNQQPTTKMVMFLNN
ncbi:Hemoglobin and hemoglobin-haptoglobin binding protein B [Haemophilus influenzae]|nr:Hemoglobin and hemoglobin-haptoglobin binding protein B [Haemophilus influenzae]